MEERKRKGMKNVIISTTVYFFMVLFQFANRTVFVHLLSTEYLGLNGLFTNVLSFLSLAELGIGTAIGYALYKPIAFDDIETIKSLMNLYRKLYTFVGMFVLSVGLLLTPFLPCLIKDMPKNMHGIYLYYVLYVINSGVSYFFTYKRTLLISDQKQYISSLTANGSKIILAILQVIVLKITHNYTLYLLSMIFITVSENFLISMIADKNYPYLRDKNIKRLNKNIIKELKKNISAIVFHKIGAVVVYSTDNIIISKFVGLSAIGIYSNYTLIVNAINNLLNQIFVALTASVGNLSAVESDEHKEEVFRRILFANYWIYSFAVVCLMCLVNNFIGIWIGEKYIFGMSTVVAISINLYLNGMRKAVGMFKDAAGIFWQDRYKPVIESVINIVVSIPLAQYYGVKGVIIGTIVSTITVPIWFEGYVTYKYSFHRGCQPYVYMQLKYFVYTCISGLVTYKLVGIFSGGAVGNFILQIIVAVVVSNIVVILLNFNSKEFKYFFNLGLELISKYRRKNEV